MKNKDTPLTNAFLNEIKTFKKSAREANLVYFCRRLELRLNRLDRLVTKKHKEGQ